MKIEFNITRVDVFRDRLGVEHISLQTDEDSPYADPRLQEQKLSLKLDCSPGYSRRWIDWAIEQGVPYHVVDISGKRAKFSKDSA